MADTPSKTRPTARDLAGSAADLRGYAMLFRGIAAGGDKEGDVVVKAVMMARAANFFDNVVGELLDLIDDEPVDLPKR